ncbi:condensation domain-containing protein [Salinispora arenicola]|uniref:condensation domain-containing protein n=1 Tax=Salinispora arenicola TaxID=168697 RepID=UPI0003600DB1|nr:condensation domain-containing protein [Salinispora arenicola]
MVNKDLTDPLAQWLAMAPGQADMEVADRTRPLPASAAQRGLWLAQQISGERSTGYVVRHAYRLRGHLHIDALASGVSKLIERHEILRTTFTVVDGELTQRIEPATDVPLDPIPIPGTTPEQRLAALDQMLASEVRRPVDLESDPMLRARLFQLDTDDAILLLVVHHIANDAWSMGVLHSDLAELYAAAVDARPPQLPNLPVQYADFASWQHGQLSGPEATEQLAYWRTRLNGAPPLLAVPTDRPRPPVQSFAGGWISFHGSPELAAAVDATARGAAVTRFTVLLAAFQVVLSRWSGQHDLVIGTGVSQRPVPETEDMIGPFTNVLPLRQTIRPELTLAAVLAESGTTLLTALRHGEVPFETLLDKLDVPRSPAFNPLTQVAISSHEGLIEPLELTGLRTDYLPAEQVDAQRDLTLFITTEGALTGRLAYAADLFDKRTIATLVADYLTVLDAAANRPGTGVGDLVLQGPPRKTAAPAPQPTPASTAPDDTLLPLVREAWAAVLNRPDVTPVDDFFLLGGTSMAAMRLCTRLSYELGIRVPVRSLFGASRLSAFTARVHDLVATHLSHDRPSDNR